MNHFNGSRSLFLKAAHTVAEKRFRLKYSAHSRSVSVSNTFISSKIYISSDTVYTIRGHIQCLQPACMFLVLEVDLTPILLDHVTLFSVSHAADKEHHPLINPPYLTRNMLQQTHVISHRNSLNSRGCRFLQFSLYRADICILDSPR